MKKTVVIAKPQIRNDWKQENSGMCSSKIPDKIKGIVSYFNKNNENSPTFIYGESNDCNRFNGSAGLISLTEKRQFSHSLDAWNNE